MNDYVYCIRLFKKKEYVLHHFQIFSQISVWASTPQSLYYRSIAVLHHAIK